MARSPQLRLTTFLPAEVAKITGVSAGLQRTWRHQGYLHRRSGASWTKHTLLQTAALLVQGELFQRGIPPRVSRICSKVAAPQISHWAQINPRSTAGSKSFRSHRTRLKRKSKPHRFLIQWGIGRRSYEFTNDLTAFYRRKRSQELAAAIVIDLMRLADHLVLTAGRPLVEVT